MRQEGETHRRGGAQVSSAPADVHRVRACLHAFRTAGCVALRLTPAYCVLACFFQCAFFFLFSRALSSSEHQTS